MASKVPVLPHIKPVRYRAGLRFWHTHQHVLNAASGVYDYPPDAFYAGCRYRFSGALATPPRAMWYAGSSCSCSLAETVLRDAFADADGFVDVLPHWIAGRQLIAMRSRRSLHFLELTPDGLHRAAGDAATATAWHQLTITPHHAETHAPTAELLAAADATGIAIDGFLWHSRQSGGRTAPSLACALFAPPATSGDFEIDETIDAIDLDNTNEGWAVIRQALADAGMLLRSRLSAVEEDTIAE